MLQMEQNSHHHQKQCGQLGGRHPVVHGQPGLVNAGGESLDAEVAGDPVVGQCFHQGQRHAGRHCRAGERQGDRADAP